MGTIFWLMLVGVAFIYLAKKAEEDNVNLKLVSAWLYGVGIYAIVGAALIAHDMNVTNMLNVENKCENVKTDIITTDTIVVEDTARAQAVEEYLQKQGVKVKPKLPISLMSLFPFLQDEEQEKEQFITHVTLTVYNAKISQCDSNPLETADQTIIDIDRLKRGELKYCAVSRDLLPFIPYGSMIEIEGHGVYEVHDTMNKRYNHYVDILQHEDEPIFKKFNVKVTKVA